MRRGGGGAAAALRALKAPEPRASGRAPLRAVPAGRAVPVLVLVSVPVSVRARGCHRAAAAASMALGRGARSSSPARMAPAAGPGRCHGCAALTSERLKRQRPGSQAAAPAGAEGLQASAAPWRFLRCHSRCAAAELVFFVTNTVEKHPPKCQCDH